VTTDGAPAQLCTFHIGHRRQNRAKTAAAAHPHPANGGRDPVFVSHGSATQWRMISNQAARAVIGARAKAGSG
jgi:hypothetical protein